MKEYYKEDLAFIHDVGHGGFAFKSAPGILKILERNGIRKGLVVDLGCGSGLWAARLVEAGYDVLGIDISESMIRIARKRAPEAEFRVASLFNVDIPPCNVVTSLGECINYLFDPRNDFRALANLFGRIYGALAPGGVFVFDIAEPGQAREGTAIKGFNEGKDWTVLFEKEEDPKQAMLTRRIVTFRKVGKYYRRDDEVHRQRLYEAADVARELRKTGFQVRTARSYGQHPLPKAHRAFIARKPGR